MKRKIILSVVLISMFLMTMATAVLANDNNTFSLEVDKTSAMVGDTIAVTILNAEACAGVEGVLKYDPEALTYQSVSFGESLAERNNNYRSIRNLSPGEIRFSIVGDTANGTTGDWATFVFEVNKEFGGSSQVSMSDVKISDVSANLTKESGTSVEVNITSVEITDASITLGESITVNYYATLADEYKEATMQFTMNEKVVSVEGELVEGNEYRFAFEGVSPQCMTDEIEAQLMCGEEILDTHDSFTIRSYCDSLLTSDAVTLGMSGEKYAAMKTLVADLLEYGAMSQTYRNYKTDALANKNITEQREFVVLTDEWKAAPKNTGDNVKITAGGVWFANVNKLYLKFTTTDISNTKLEFDGKTYTNEDFELVSGNTYIFYSDAITPSEFGVGKAAQFKYGDTVEASITYCVNNYVYAKQSQNTNMGKLVRALYNYSVSAAEYMGLQ